MYPSLSTAVFNQEPIVKSHGITEETTLLIRTEEWKRDEEENVFVCVCVCRRKIRKVRR